MVARRLGDGDFSAAEGRRRGVSSSANAALRLSLGRWTTEDELRHAAQLIAHQLTPRLASTST